MTKIILAIIAPILLFFGLRSLNLRKIFNPQIFRLFKKGGKWKNYFYDKYYFNKYSGYFNSGSLFIVFSKKNEEIFNKLASPREKLRAKKSGQQKDRDPFRYLRVGNGNYLLINPELFKSKDDDPESLNPRLLKIIKYIRKLRREFLMDGIVLIPEQDVIFAKSKESGDGETSEALLVSRVYDSFVENFKISIPLYFFLDNYTESGVFNEFIETYKETYRNDFVGYINPSKEVKSEDNHVESQLNEFLNSLELSVRNEIETGQEQGNELKLISYSFQINLLVTAFKENYLDLVFELNENTETPPYFRGLIFFDNKAESESFVSLERAFSFVANNEAGVTQNFKEVIEKSQRKVTILGWFSFLFTLGLIGVFIYSLLDLDKKNNFIVQKFTNLSNYITNYQQDLIQHQSSIHNDYIEEGCKLLEDGNQLISFSYFEPGMASSWTFTFDEDILDIYSIRLSSAISHNLISDFNIFVRNMFLVPHKSGYSEDFEMGELKKLENISLKDVSYGNLKEFLVDLKEVSNIYDEIYSSDDGNEKQSKDEKSKTDNGESESSESSKKFLKDIAHILYNKNCSESNFANLVFKSLKVEDVQASLLISKDDISHNAMTKLEYLIKDYMSNTALSNSFITYVKKFADALTEGFKFSASYSSQNFENLSNKVDNIISSYEELSKFISLQGQNYISAQALSGQGFQELLQDITQIESLGKDAKEKADSIVDEYYIEFKNKILSITSPLYASQIIVDEKGALLLDPSVASYVQNLSDMKSFLDSTMSEKNITAVFSGKYDALPKVIPANTYWNIDKLRDSVQKVVLVEKIYNSLDQTKYSQTADNFYNLFSKSILHNYWENHLASIIEIDDTNETLFSKGDSSEQGGADAKDGNIPSAAPLLKTVLTSFDNHNLLQDKTIFLKIINKQISSYLNDYYTNLFYSNVFKMNVSNFSWWDGTYSPSLRSFGVVSADDLKSYITLQSKQIENLLAIRISPILDAYKSLNDDPNYLNTSDTSILNWKILQDMFGGEGKAQGNKKKDNKGDDKKDDKKDETSTTGENPLELLSDFILTTMTNLRTNTCPDFIEMQDSINKLGTDFFSQRQKSIYTPLREVCLSLFNEVSVSYYNDIAKSFNQSLSKRFPFSEKGDFSNFADLNSMLSIFSKFKYFKTNNFNFLMKHNKEFKENKKVQFFVDSLDKVNKFLQIKEDKNGLATSPQLKIKLSFRTNRQFENLGNQIINWNLQLGKKNIGSNYGDLSEGELIWNYGDQLRFLVTIANSSKYKALSFNQNSYLQVIGRDIFVSDKSPWSLLKFVNVFTTCGNYSLCKVQNLKFTVPLQGKKNLIFYVTIALEDVTTGDVIELPAFPVQGEVFK